MDPQISQYIESAVPEQQRIMTQVREIIHQTVPDVQESFKWSRPIFSTSKDFAYLKTAKNYVTLGFNDFSKFEDPDGKLEGTGSSMRHIKIKTAADIDPVLLEKWFKAASQ
jgi:hypothetical protein